jgi:hypothetical protein
MMFLAPHGNLRQIAAALVGAPGAILDDTDVGIRITFLIDPPDPLVDALRLAGALPVPVDHATGQQAGSPFHG